MTEDDTFNKLKKATFNDVRIRLSNQTLDEMKFGKWVEILESMGWTEKEYLGLIVKMGADPDHVGALG